MDRRAFLAVISGALPCAAANVRAQRTERVRRIGLLGVEAYSPEQRGSVRAALAERGWVEGRNLVVVERYAGGDTERLRRMADDLVAQNVDLIVSGGTVASLAAKRATSTIPIVVYGSGDPLSTGLVSDLARPGGNITGNTTLSNELDHKRLQLLREILPGVKRIGKLVNPANPVFRAGREDVERAYRALGLDPLLVDVRSEADLEAAVEEVVRRGGQALIVSADPLFAGADHTERIARAAQRLALPLMAEDRGALDAGGLISLTVNWDEQDRQVASLVDRILRGAKPGDLPFERPTRFEIVVNLKAAKVLGIAVPQSVLLRASEVIQ